MVVMVTVARWVTMVVVGWSCNLVAMVVICWGWSSYFCTSCLMDFIEPIEEKYKSLLLIKILFKVKLKKFENM